MGKCRPWEDHDLSRRPPNAPKPVLGATEPRDEHNKFYAEQSVKDAIKEFQIREGFASYSEACRALILVAFMHPGVYGGYEIR